MVKVRTLKSGFFAGYGFVSAGTIIELDGIFALSAVIDGSAQRID